MKPEIKKLWVDNLLSGKYPQIGKVLHGKGGFCCLGVLCDIYLKESGDVESEWQFSDTYQSQAQFKDSLDGFVTEEFLPGCVMEWAELEQIDPVVKVVGKVADDNDYEYFTLSKLNDDGYTFEQIAELIQEQL